MNRRSFLVMLGVAPVVPLLSVVPKFKKPIWETIPGNFEIYNAEHYGFKPDDKIYIEWTNEGWDSAGYYHYDDKQLLWTVK